MSVHLISMLMDPQEITQWHTHSIIYNYVLNQVKHTGPLKITQRVTDSPLPLVWGSRSLGTLPHDGGRLLLQGSCMFYGRGSSQIHWVQSLGQGTWPYSGALLGQPSGGQCSWTVQSEGCTQCDIQELQHILPCIKSNSSAKMLG